MIQSNHPCDPKVHETAIRIARRCLFIIQTCLREYEWDDALREFYLVAREEMERVPRHGD
jgi:hypothetical protein